MAIYFMHGKTFLKDFINEDPEKVLRAHFVLVSATLRSSGRWQKQVIKGTCIFPNNRLLSDLASTDGTKHDIDDFLCEYREQLKENDPFFATLVKGAIEEKFTIIFVCGYNERKLRYLNEIARYIEDTFHYPVYNYKKYKKGKQKPVKYDKEAALSKANKVIDKARKRKYKNDLGSVNGREGILKDMDKKAMKKKLKSMNLYYPGMSKSEMKDSLEVFFVNS